MSTASHMQQVNVANSGNKGTHNKQQLQQNGVGSGSGSSASTTPPSSQGAASLGGPGAPVPPPGTTMAPQQQPPPSQSTSPPVNNAPKYGTLVPNRIFVGGISANTTEVELAQLFSAYGTVKATKIISDRAGVSKGYGFVTFESEEEAKRLQRESDNIMLRERRLNIAPAIKKQPFNRGFEVSSPPPTAAGQTQFYYAAAAAAGGVPYAYQNGMAYYTPAPPQTTGANGELSAAQPLYQAPPVYATPTAAPPAGPYPMPMYPPQPLFVQHQYPYQPIPYDPQQYYGGAGGQAGNGGGSSCGQYVYGGGGSAMAGGQCAAGGAGAATGAGGASGGAAGSGPPPGPGQASAQAAAAGSASPTRAAYYHQHIAPYSADGMYYNLPMYNVAIDPSAGIYTTEGVDTTSMSAVSEVSHSMPPGIHVASNMDLNMYVKAIPMSADPAVVQGAQQTYSAPQQQQQHAAIVTSATVHLSASAPHNNNTITTHTKGNSHQHVPVAPSVVTINGAPPPHHGPQQSSHSHRQHVPAVFHHPQHQHQQRYHHQHRRGPQPPPHHQHGAPAFIVSSAFKLPAYNNHVRPKCESNYCRTWSKKRRNHESASVSSLRTDSNSSASVVDENLNEKKDTMSPPPTPYSPMAHLESGNYNANNHNLQVAQPNHVSHHGPPSYFQGGGRRNRRNNPRRQPSGAAASGQAQEVGAGDAPMSEVTDMCKKIDNLKL